MQLSDSLATYIGLATVYEDAEVPLSVSQDAYAEPCTTETAVYLPVLHPQHFLTRTPYRPLQEDHRQSESGSW